MSLQYTFYGTCLGKTKKGTPCRHTTVYANGYCKQHGGDSTEYMLMVRDRLAEKQRRRVERWWRKFRSQGTVLPDARNEGDDNG